MTDLTPRSPSARLLFGWLRLPLSRKLAGPPRFMSLPSLHATVLRDPGSLSGFSPSRTLLSGFCHVKGIADCFDFLRGCINSRGLANPPAACMVPVYASHMSFYRDARLPLFGCPTRTSSRVCPPAAFFRSFMCATLGLSCWLDFE